MGIRSITAGWVAVVLLAGLSSAPAASAAPGPATVAVATQPIVALAAGGGRVAYRTHFANRYGHVCNSVHVLPLGGGPETVPRSCSPVRNEDHGSGLALGSHVLVYDSIDWYPANSTHDETEATVWRVGRDGTVRLADDFYEVTCSGESVGRLAYGGGALFTRIVATEVDPAMECQNGSGGGPGVSSMTSAGMRYAPAGTAAAASVSGAPGAARLAARWPALAIVPLKLPQAMGERLVPPTRGTERVESWNLRTRTRRCTAGFAGVPAAVATNGAQIAAIVPTSPGHRLVRISARTCARIGSVALGRHIQPALAMGRNVAAWVSGRSVMTLNLATGSVSRLYRGTLVPHGLVLSDGRLVWWVAGRHASRVLRFALP